MTALLLLITTMVLFLSGEARLNEQPIAVENEMTTPRDDVPALQLHRELSTCDAKLTCETFAGFDGRLVSKQVPILKLFGAGCRNKCVGTATLTLHLEFLGWDCGACPP